MIRKMLNKNICVIHTQTHLRFMLKYICNYRPYIDLFIKKTISTYFDSHEKPLNMNLLFNISEIWMVDGLNQYV